MMHTRHNVAKNNYSINLAKIYIKMEYGCITKKTPKSVSDTGEPYHVASLQQYPSCLLHLYMCCHLEAPVLPPGGTYGSEKPSSGVMYLRCCW